MNRSITVNCPYCGESAVHNVNPSTEDCTLFGCPRCGNYYAVVTSVEVSVSVRKIEGYGEEEQDG